MRKLIVIAVLVTCAAFTRYGLPDKPVPIPPSKQRLGGDPKKGFDYLTTGDYVKSGIPYQIFAMGLGKQQKSYLKREGINKNIPYEYTAVKAFN